MALARKLTKTRIPRKPRITASQAKIVNRKWLGDEPSFEEGAELTQLEQSIAYNWYNANIENDEARSFLVEYLTSKDREAEAEQIKKVPDEWMSFSLCWIARLRLKGYTVQESSSVYFEKTLKMLIDKHTVETFILNDGEGIGNKTSIQDNIKQKIFDFIGYIEGLVDENEPFSMYDQLKAQNFPAKFTSRVSSHFTELKEEYEGALHKTDPDLVEGYSHYTKEELKFLIAHLETLIEESDRYGSNTKKLRAPRQARPISIDKKFKHFKYKAEDTDLKIASARATDIVGAQEVWLYASSVKQLTVLRALDRGGLDIKRSTITGYDPATSMTKRCGGRNIVDTIQTIVTGGKVALRKLMDDIGSQPIEISDKSTSNTIILRVVKG